MIDFLIGFLIQQHFILFYLIPFVLVIKIFLFAKNRTRSWRLSNFFYFDASHIVTSRSNNVETAKRIQNVLSFIILMLAAIQVGLFLLIKG